MLVGFSPFKASLWGMAVLTMLYVARTRRIDKDLIAKIAGSVSEGARNVITISAACAAAGVISGTLGITGLGSKIALLIDVASNGYLILALVFTMIASIVLGMGLPTTAAYLILATVVAPALVKLGVADAYRAFLRLLLRLHLNDYAAGSPGVLCCRRDCRVRMSTRSGGQRRPMRSRASFCRSHLSLVPGF